MDEGTTLVAELFSVGTAISRNSVLATRFTV